MQPATFASIGEPAKRDDNEIDDDAIIRIRCCHKSPAPFCGIRSCADSPSIVKLNNLPYHEDVFVELEFKYVRKCRLWRDDIQHNQIGSRRLEISTFRPLAVVQLVADYLRYCNMRKVTNKSPPVFGFVGFEEKPHDVPDGVRFPPLDSNTDLIEAVIFYNEVGFEWLENYAVQKICGKIMMQAWPVAGGNSIEAGPTERVVPLGGLLAYFLGGVETGCAERSAGCIVNATTRLLARRMAKLQWALRRQLRNLPVFAVQPKRITWTGESYFRHAYRHMLYNGEMLEVMPLISFLPTRFLTKLLLRHVKPPGHPPFGTLDDGEHARKASGNESYEKNDGVTCFSDVQKFLQFLSVIGSVFDGNSESSDTDVEDNTDGERLNSIIMPCRSQIEFASNAPLPVRSIIRFLQAQLLYCIDEAASLLCQMMWRSHKIAHVIADALELAPTSVEEQADKNTIVGRHMFHFNAVVAAYIESYVGYRRVIERRVKLRPKDSSLMKELNKIEADFGKVCMQAEKLPFAVRLAENYARCYWQLSCEVVGLTIGGDDGQNHGDKVSVPANEWVGCSVKLRVMPLLATLGDVFACLCRVFIESKGEFAENKTFDPEQVPFTICYPGEGGALKFDHQLCDFNSHVMPREHCVAGKLRQFLHESNNSTAFVEPLESVLAKNAVNQPFMLCFRGLNEAAAEIVQKSREQEAQMLKEITVNCRHSLMASISDLNDTMGKKSFLPANVTLRVRLDSTISDLVVRLAGPKCLALGKDAMSSLRLYYYYNDVAREKALINWDDDDDGLAILNGIASGKSSRIGPCVVLERVDIASADATVFWLLKLRARFESGTSRENIQSMLSTYYAHHDRKKLTVAVHGDGKKNAVLPTKHQTPLCTCKMCKDFVRLFLRPRQMRLYYEVIPPSMDVFVRTEQLDPW